MNSYRNGKVHVCNTCIFRPGNLMHLPKGRVDEMVTEAVANNFLKDLWYRKQAKVPPSNFVDPENTESFRQAVRAHKRNR